MTTTTRTQSTTTTYVIRPTDGGPITDDHARASKTMAYTHAVWYGQGATWHTSLALANKAVREGGRVVAVEAHQGGKATVLRRLATEAPAPVEAPAAPAESTREARTWNATASATHTCAGACGQDLPAKSFPTTGTAGRRGVVCRKDRDAARKTTAAA